MTYAYESLFHNRQTTCLVSFSGTSGVPHKPLTTVPKPLRHPQVGMALRYRHLVRMRRPPPRVSDLLGTQIILRVSQPNEVR